MTKHKRRNTLYWRTCEVTTVCQWNLASLCHIPKEKKLSKISQKLRPETKFQALLHLLRIKHNLYSKMKHLKQATYIRYVLANLSKLGKISTQISSDFFLQNSLKIERGLELVFTQFSWNFLKFFFFVILYHTLTNLITRLKLFSKMCFIFHP